jgi:DNA polymerase-3 subunit epsilon
VDNSNRALHGALLDAGLLAEVYIRLTRGQESLVIDAGDAADTQVTAAVEVDLTQFPLLRIEPTPQEQAAHEALLTDLDKASGGKTLWRRLQAQPEAA